MGQPPVKQNIGIYKIDKWGKQKKIIHGEPE